MLVKQLKINFTDHKFKAGQVIDVKCNRHGEPLSQFWRRRLDDSVIDGCVEWVDSQTPQQPKEKLRLNSKLTDKPGKQERKR